MKKLLVLLTVLVFTVSAVYAANFSPTLMKLTAAPTVLYTFDGKTLDVSDRIAFFAGRSVPRV